MNYDVNENVPAVWQVGDVVLDQMTSEATLHGWWNGIGLSSSSPRLENRVGSQAPRKEFFQSRLQIENFEREAETWVNIGLHPHIVSCYYVRRLAASRASLPSSWKEVRSLNGSMLRGSMRVGKESRWSGLSIWQFRSLGDFTTHTKRGWYIRTSNRATSSCRQTELQR